MQVMFILMKIIFVMFSAKCKFCTTHRVSWILLFLISMHVNGFRGLYFLCHSLYWVSFTLLSLQLLSHPLMVLFLKGRVNIVAKPGMKLEIPDRAVLHNKVSHQLTISWVAFFF